jgi:GTP-binding protein EngB required for normal cell division
MEGISSMNEITDEFVQEMLQKTKNYTIVILNPTDKIKERGVEKIIWEHS